MGWFKKKPDPISDRERALKAEIAALDARIKQLSTHGEPARNQPRLRSTVSPPGHGPAAPSSPASPGPVLESADQNPSKPPSEAPAPDHPEPAVRGSNLAAVWRRWLNPFRRPPPNNPQLVNYLAAGSIQGLRPLRYEKRIARNRALFGAICLLLFVYALYAIFKK